jgi:hypothetical protein
MPTRLFSNDGDTVAQNYSQTMQLETGTSKIIRVQLTRVRTTDGIWGFYIFGGFGDQY